MRRIANATSIPNVSEGKSAPGIHRSVAPEFRASQKEVLEDVKKAVSCFLIFVANIVKILFMMIVGIVGCLLLSEVEATFLEDIGFVPTKQQFSLTVIAWSPI